ncbi:hypothetical protein [Methanococcus maripaludis]|uniref:Uncharacterized protein n=1 Tax=Methanococcus maripaludis TaxID=39152 RepID=A0A2L1C9R7_METMI|nr:hypothetical protein [Methanococcus maripaludis]AVB75636.1 hypothetical protein MMJJ_02170 [Methanococcus maripaludis]MBA2863971.1 hypothetical protein [Methanococcus maripaludis]MBB6496032.1 hypothetical protein [Methanococcus maripaludis]
MEIICDNYEKQGNNIILTCFGDINFIDYDPRPNEIERFPIRHIHAGMLVFEFDSEEDISEKLKRIETLSNSSYNKIDEFNKKLGTYILKTFNE